MELLCTREAQIKLSEARRLMDEALQILDELGDAGNVGAQLDLALCRLENHLGTNRPGTGPAQELRTVLENSFSHRPTLIK